MIFTPGRRHCIGTCTVEIAYAMVEVFVIGLHLTLSASTGMVDRRSWEIVLAVSGETYVGLNIFDSLKD